MQQSPDNKSPVSPMPQATNNEECKNISHFYPFIHFVTSHWYIEIIAEPLTQRNMPAPPEFGDTCRAVGARKIEGESDSETPREAVGDETVAGEIIIDSQAKKQIRKPNCKRIGCRSPVEIIGKIVG